HKQERNQRKRHTARESENHSENSESAHAPQHGSSSPLSERPVRQKCRHPYGTRGRGTAQHSQSPRTGVQYFARIDRKQGNGASQKNREKIKRDRPQQQTLIANVTQAGQDSAQTHLFAL